MTGAQVVTASQVQSIGCRLQAIRAQTLTKRKGMGTKDVVSKEKDRGLHEDMALLTTNVVPLGEISH